MTGKPGPRPLCGTAQGYRYHYRHDGHTHCLPCRAAHSFYGKRHRHFGGGYLQSAGPTSDRIRELRTGGMTLAAIAARAGVSLTALRRVEFGTREKVTARTAAAVLAITAGSVPTGVVPAAGTTRRIRALLALGWPHSSISADCGHHTDVLLAQRRASVTVRTAQDIRTTYDRLSMTVGPSRRTANAAARLGYAPPLAWDDDTIDDPTAAPPEGLSA